MKRLLAFASLALLLAVPAHAQSPKGGFGFRTGNSPFSNLPLTLLQADASPSLGLRHWMNANVGVDAGVGFSTISVDPIASTWTGFTFDLGVPISLKKLGDNVNFILRPGFQYGTLEDDSGTPAIKWTGLAFSGELEVEWMVTDNLSVSAAHGIAYTTVSDDDTPSTEITTFRTTSGNFMNLGFHVYLW